MSHSAEVRALLMDTAERLFATEGVSAVSDRRIAATAGMANNSAVSYHFGDREGLLRAMLLRNRDSLEQGRRTRFASSDSLTGDVRALVLASTDQFAQLPFPSSRARFLNQVAQDPTLHPLFKEAIEGAPSIGAITTSVVSRLDHLDQEIVRARARLTTRVFLNGFADIESLAERTGQPAQWHAAGLFLSDAVAGMLAAPISEA